MIVPNSFTYDKLYNAYFLGKQLTLHVALVPKHKTVFRIQMPCKTRLSYLAVMAECQAYRHVPRWILLCYCKNCQMKHATWPDQGQFATYVFILHMHLTTKYHYEKGTRPYRTKHSLLRLQQPGLQIGYTLISLHYWTMLQQVTIFIFNTRSSQTMIRKQNYLFYNWHTTCL